MTAKRSVIFDMDGVMVDTEPLYFEANSRTFNKLGFSVSHESYARFVGIDAALMWAALKKEHRLLESIDDLVRMEKEGMFQAVTENNLQPMNGLVDLMDALGKEGFTLGLASSSPYKIIYAILDKLGVRDRFSAIVSGEDVANGKPAPDIFLLAGGMLHTPPERCTVIEDSANGVRGAKAAGMKCAGFRNPGSMGQDLSPADLIVNDFSSTSIQALLELASR